MSVEGLASRDAALQALLDFSSKGAFVADSLGRHGRDLDPRDRALALEAALVAVRWKARLDHHLDRFLRGATPEPVRWILRLGLAQCRVLDRVPAHAAVHLSVELARIRFGRGSAGLVNAVLRRAVDAPWDDPSGDDPRALSVRFSHPEWLVRRWIGRHGIDAAQAMLRAGCEDPAVWVRVRAGADALPWDPADETGSAFGGFFRRVSVPRERILSSEAFRSGTVSFQDPSSGACALALEDVLAPGSLVLDACAAPGGKLACLHDRGALEGVRALAFDLSVPRQERTSDGFRRLGVAALVGVADATRLPLREGSLDAALVDAPCSNLGVLSRRPEARWRARPDDPRRHGALQRRILEAVATRVKPGGTLVYSTCSTEPEEGEQVVRDLDGWETASAETTLPGTGDGDGFFLAVLRRRSRS